jgi:putative ABC transport system permease protein
MGLAGALSDTLRGNTPFDATLSVRADSEAETAYPGVDIVAAAREKGVDLDAFAAEYLAVRYYGADVSFTPDLNGYERDFGLNFMKLSDYNAVLAMQGVAPVSLGAGEYALDSNMPSTQWREIITAYMQSGGEIELAGRSLRTDPSMLYAYMLEVSQNRSYDLVAVVPDELLLGAPAKADLLHVNYPRDGGEYEKRCTAALRGLDFAEGGGDSYAGLQTKAMVLEYSDSATATIAYLAVYMGVVSLLMAATVQARGQLSEAGANVDRYGLLRKIGAEDRMIRGALFTQVFVYFCAPVLPALVHAAVGIAVAGKLVNFFGEMDIFGGSLFAAVAVVIVYGGYFLAAYMGSRRMVMKGF